MAKMIKEHSTSRRLRPNTKQVRGRAEGQGVAAAVRRDRGGRKPLEIAQAEADRYADYVEQKDRVEQAEEDVATAERQFFALGETPGDLAYWRRCIAIANRERAQLRAIGH